MKAATTLKLHKLLEFCRKLNESGIDPKAVLKWEIKYDKTHTILGEPSPASDSPVDVLKRDIPDE